MIKLNEFENAYGKLNAHQKKAVDTIDGPVMVIAGPGTGKTTVLTLRIANILRLTDTPPDAILALTFTESGVAAMRQKLTSIIGSSAYRVRIHTFHSFANNIINSYPDHFTNVIGRQNIDDLAKHQLVQEVINEREFKYLRPRNAPEYYVGPCIAAIRDLKRENVSPENFAISLDREDEAIASSFDAYHTSGKSKGKMKGNHIIRLERSAKNRELLAVFAGYERKMADRKFFDFEDMIMETVRVLESDPDLALRIQEEAQYILADEHQDANNAQNRLLEIISSFHDTPNLFIVGDEKQAIFRFQGASLENFLYFKRKFPQASVITLTDNYRSHQNILDAAHSLIGNNVASAAPRPEPLKASSKNEPKPIIVGIAPDESSERQYVTEKIAELLKSGIKSSDIAVLVRENKETEAIERVLSQAGIPATRVGGSDALENIHIEAFINMLEASDSPSDENLAKVLFHEFNDLDAHEVYLLIESARRGRTSLLSELRRRPQFSEFLAKLAKFTKMCRNEYLVTAINQIAWLSGYMAYILALPEAKDVLRLYDVFLRGAERNAELNKKAKVSDYLLHLKDLQKHGFKLESGYSSSSGVSIMTAHRAKGLEFDSVFIMHAKDSSWGGKKPHTMFHLPGFGGEDQSIDDERRLFYVALTRARHEPYITYSERDKDGRKIIQSRFIDEIDERLKLRISIRPTPPAVSMSVAKPAILDDREYLTKLFIERGLSVTHLNNYLKCPWRYFFVDLLRLPQSQNPILLYGSAIHAALKYYFGVLREGRSAVEEAVKTFVAQLERSYMPEVELKRYLSAGKKELTAYLQHWQFSNSAMTEYRIQGLSLPLQDGRAVSLNGSLDKIELLSGNGVNVVDYKTGKPKSRNDIEGKTKQSDGDYKRQLTFYKLLLQMEGKWVMKTATIDFIRPDEKGNFHRETLEVADEETNTLRKLVTETAEEILRFDFYGKTCGDTDCQFCRMAKLLRRSAAVPSENKTAGTL